jgi:SAM-dependent methyltransferase
MPLNPPSSGSDGDKYGPHYYRHYWGDGGPYERNERWMEFFDGIAESIVRNLHPASVLDAGCAMGLLVETLSRRGVDAWGIDVSEYAISQVDDSVRDRCSVASLTDLLPRRYDLITCIEVIEHIPPAETGKVVANLCQASNRILLSSTPRDYGEPTHLNVQQPEDWAAAFAREGFLRDLDHDASYISPWATLYVRTEEPLTETVRRYDRSWWRLHMEVSEMREALLALQDRLGKIESGESEDRSALHKEIDLQKEELLRLRDLLIGKAAELGLARGRLAELEDRSTRLDNAVGRVRSIVPGFVWTGVAGLRRLRQRS